MTLCSRTSWCAVVLAAAPFSLVLPMLDANAVDLSATGFGTLGYARSDQPFAYQRSINDGGTLRRDSIFGVQIDAKLDERWSATMQATLAPDDDDDHAWRLKPSWAFISFRPGNDLIARVGKLRVTSFLSAENRQIGATYAYAQLPVELYSTAPTLDLFGASIGKSWETSVGDVTLDAWYGKANDLSARFYLRDGLPGYAPPGPLFIDYRMKSGGIALTLRHDDDTYRVAFDQTVVRLADGSAFAVSYPFVSLGNGQGYYKTNTVVPGPEIPSADTLRVYGTNLGADIGLGERVRLTAEFSRSQYANVDTSGTASGFAALRWQLGPWTPYASYARILSDQRARELFQRVNEQTIPAPLPNADLINASQRLGADFVRVYDQYTLAIGTSYALRRNHMLKAELARVHVGEVSALVDVPTGTNIRNTNIHVMSVSYNFVF